MLNTISSERVLRSLYRLGSRGLAFERAASVLHGKKKKDLDLD